MVVYEDDHNDNNCDAVRLLNTKQCVFAATLAWRDGQKVR